MIEGKLSISVFLGRRRITLSDKETDLLMSFSRGGSKSSGSILSNFM